MKGNKKLIDALNKRLAEELTAINQYMVHAEMCENWKYSRLQEVIRKRAIVEMVHAEKLIERIKLAVEVADNGTKELLDMILKEEEGHIDWIESQLDQIKQMGVQNYLE